MPSAMAPPPARSPIRWWTDERPARGPAHPVTIERLTQKAYWDQKYQSGGLTTLSTDGARNRLNRDQYEAMKRVALDGKRVLEIGAGDSQWLPFLAKLHPTSRFTGLDYSEQGCEQLRRRAEAAGVAIEVICADLFAPPAVMKDAFDVVFTIGVVEHFDDLAATLATLAGFLKPGGRLYTQIPNLTGPLGMLCRWLDRSVYDIHNPHGPATLAAAHATAGLQVEQTDLIGATGFNMLSSCLNPGTSAQKRLAYKALAGVSRATSLWEARCFRLPTSEALSPLMYCIARKG